MPSFLTTERMSPQLKRRVLISLSSDMRERAGGAPQRKGHGLVRSLIAAGALGCAVLLFLTYRQSRAELRRERAELLSRYERERAPFTEPFRARLAHAERILAHATDTYAGDFLDPSLKQPGSLDALLRRPLAYVRGPIRAFQTEPDRRQSSREGGPDALIRCLLVPPPSIKESDLLRHLGRIYEPRRFSERFYDLEPAHAGFSFVDAGFDAELVGAQRMKQVLALRSALLQADLRRAAHARDAELFAFAFDEPKPPGAVADLDGEAVHFIRFSIVELGTSRVWLRVRREVDPQWLSDKSRAAYSRELDGCRLAAELRQHIELPVGSLEGGQDAAQLP